MGTGGSNPGMLTPAVQVGIVSHHEWPGKCEDPEYPGVYTRVSHVWGWITDTVFQQTGELGPSSPVQPTGPGSKSSKRTAALGKH